jgi:6-pyruvoyltetrahydropterin/6-carboxytetrahydropterin synthase
MKKLPPVFEISQSFYFEAAHTLHRDYESAGSRRIHGHTYEAEVTVSGIPDQMTGMVVDLYLLRGEIERVKSLLDHHFLDEVINLGPPTLENLSLFIAENLKIKLPKLCSVVVQRKCSGDKCTYKL